MLNVYSDSDNLQPDQTGMDHTPHCWHLRLREDDFEDHEEEEETEDTDEEEEGTDEEEERKENGFFMNSQCRNSMECFQGNPSNSQSPSLQRTYQYLHGRGLQKPACGREERPRQQPTTEGREGGLWEGRLRRRCGKGRGANRIMAPTSVGGRHKALALTSKRRRPVMELTGGGALPPARPRQRSIISTNTKKTLGSRGGGRTAANRTTQYAETTVKVTLPVVSPEHFKTPSSNNKWPYSWEKTLINKVNAGLSWIEISRNHEPFKTTQTSNIQLKDKVRTLMESGVYVRGVHGKLVPGPHFSLQINRPSASDMEQRKRL
eukprot:GHVQ01016673.1.p1 GENE.GHVQ01016673.1~~GHVQ01016673.1.p1  ORF type:complete len:320 (+),score=53.15 GHVQ01016673.1:299-1258(+)